MEVSGDELILLAPISKPQGKNLGAKKKETAKFQTLYFSLRCRRLNKTSFVYFISILKIKTFCYENIKFKKQLKFDFRPMGNKSAVPLAEDTTSVASVSPVPTAKETLRETPSNTEPIQSVSTQEVLVKDATSLPVE